MELPGARGAPPATRSGTGREAGGGQNIGEGAQRAFGRSLADFSCNGQGPPHGLWPAEEKLLEAARAGEICKIGTGRAKKATRDNRLRASFIRFLALGGDAEAAVHESGVRLEGAYVDGDLDLWGCNDVKPIALSACRIAGAVILRHARIPHFDLGDSHVVEIQGKGAKITGDVRLNDGFEAEGAVRLTGAEIGGGLNCTGGSFKGKAGTAIDLEGAKIAGSVFLRENFRGVGEVRLLDAEIGSALVCTGGSFKNEGGDALDFDRAKITGSVFLNNGFEAVGMVRFLGVEIGHVLDCTGGSFDNRNDIALIFDRAKINGNVYLRSGFNVVGKVRLKGAKIGGDLYCSGGSFSHKMPRDEGVEDNDQSIRCCDYALDASGARIDGTLWLGPFPQPFGPSPPPNDNQVKLEGSLNLGDVTAAVLVDHRDSWPVEGVTGPSDEALNCVIRLDGFTYGHFSRESSLDAADRKAWLKRQPPGDLGPNFKPQPFEQLAKVYREMGHPKDARRIAMFKGRLRLRRSWRGRPWWQNPLNWGRWLLVEKLTGYGYRAHRLIIPAFLVWLAAAFFYSEAARNGAMVPTDAEVLVAVYNFYSEVARNSAKVPTDAEVLVPVEYKGCHENWINCKHPLMKLYTPFRPAIYALDALLPIVSLGQEAAWRPMRKKFKIYGVNVPDWAGLAFMWVEIGLGWALGLVLAAIIGSAVKRD